MNEAMRLIHTDTSTHTRTLTHTNKQNRTCTVCTHTAYTARSKAHMCTKKNMRPLSFVALKHISSHAQHIQQPKYTHTWINEQRHDYRISIEFGSYATQLSNRYFVTHTHTHKHTYRKHIHMHTYTHPELQNECYCCCCCCYFRSWRQSS